MFIGGMESLLPLLRQLTPAAMADALLEHPVWRRPWDDAGEKIFLDDASIFIASCVTQARALHFLVAWTW